MTVRNVPRSPPETAQAYPKITLAIAVGMCWTGVECVVEPVAHSVNIETDAESVEEPISATAC